MDSYSNDPNQQIAVIAAHMEHLAKDMGEVRTDLKGIPEKMSVLYVPQTEFIQFKQDFQVVRQDIHDLSQKMDARDQEFVTKKELADKQYVTRDQFAPIRTVAYFLGGAFITGVVSFLFWILQSHYHA